MHGMYTLGGRTTDFYDLGTAVFPAPLRRCPHDGLERKAKDFNQLTVQPCKIRRDYVLK